jgi:hypothetical protein
MYVYVYSTRRSHKGMLVKAEWLKELCTVYPPISGIRILLSDILGRRRPVGFARDSYPIRSGTLSMTCQLRDRPLPRIGGYTVVGFRPPDVLYLWQCLAPESQSRFAAPLACPRPRSEITQLGRESPGRGSVKRQLQIKTYFQTSFLEVPKQQLHYSTLAW